LNETVFFQLKLLGLVKLLVKQFSEKNCSTRPIGHVLYYTYDSELVSTYGALQIHTYIHK